MAEVRIDYKITGLKENLSMIDKIMTAIDWLGMEMDYDEECESIEMHLDSISIPNVLEWTGLINAVLKAKGIENIAYKMRGVADNDYNEYTAFEIESNMGEVKKKEFDFSGDEDLEDEDFFSENYDEEEVFLNLEKKKAKPVNSDELRYDEDEYETVINALDEEDEN